jgi:hypothetical protein
VNTYFTISPRLIIAVFFSLFVHKTSFSQTPGVINRQATSAGGRAILDPNGDGYTSATTAGFGSNDVTNSELPFTPVKAYSIEPYSDLRRGPNHSYSDFVPDSSGNGVYRYFSGGLYMLFRMRMGSIMPGSKGYSILMDTDGKFGATGVNADPNYQPSTTGVNGNPGFEIEVVLETNFRIAIYNVDGSSTPTLVKQYTNWQDMSQVSLASTNDNGDPDFLIDFYIPFSDLQAAPFNLTTSSSIRMTATTVMAPQAAIGGPRSDIYGVSGDSYEDFINGQPACNIFSYPSTCLTAMCTAAPSVNTPIGTGTVNISGTWTKSVLTGAASSATITVYKNGVSVGTVSNVSSSSTWTLNNIALINGDIITAKAQATAESMCLTSNAVTASTCNASNIPATPVLTCTSGSKGLEGTNLSTGWTIHVDNVTRNVLDNSVSNSTGLFGSQTGSSPNITWMFSGGCSSGAPLTSGSYKVYYTNNSTGCNSLPAYFCAAGNGGTALAGSLAVPTITAPASAIFTTATKTITGTTDANTALYLYINGINIQSTTANGAGAFSFSNLTLLNGQQLYILAELNTGTVSTSKCANQTPLYTVSCYTGTPVITVDVNNQLTASAPITGTSADAAGTIIRVYTSANTLVATTTVQANGTWSTGNAGTTPATYNAAAGTSYYATAQNGTCGLSSATSNFAAATTTSSARCGTITGSINSAATSISGTLTGSFTTTTVNLYLDGTLIGTTTTNNTAWGPVTVNSSATNTLYSNGVLSIGVRESSKQETACPASATTIICSPAPATPTYTISSNNVNQNQTITCTINNAVTGTFYALSDSASGQSFGQGQWASSNGNLTLTSDALNTPGTYNVKVNGTSMSGITLCSQVSASTSLTVNAVVLPLLLIEFNGKNEQDKMVLDWVTENELNTSRFEIERSADGKTFNKINVVSAAGNNTIKKYYNFTDAAPLRGKNYYRLKIIDADGKQRLSNIIILSTNKNETLLISNPAPNPFTDKIYFTITLNKATPVTLQIIDNTARVLRSVVLAGKKDTNTVNINGLNSLAAGAYCIRVITADEIITQKILKL